MLKGFLSGRLGKDCEVKQVNGKNVINFPVATEEGYGENKKTLWIDVAYWTDKTGIAPYLLKGQQVVVAGDVSMRKWETGAIVTMRADRIELVGSAKEAVSAPAQHDPASDLPF